jgi:hypothetical protein
MKTALVNGVDAERNCQDCERLIKNATSDDEYDTTPLSNQRMIGRGSSKEHVSEGRSVTTDCYCL